MAELNLLRTALAQVVQAGAELGPLEEGPAGMEQLMPEAVAVLLRPLPVLAAAVSS